MTNSVREKLKMAQGLIPTSNAGTRAWKIINEALTQLTEMERDHEAMEKLRASSENWSLGRRPDGVRFHGNPERTGIQVGTGLYRCEADPVDAILGDSSSASDERQDHSDSAESE